MFNSIQNNALQCQYQEGKKNHQACHKAKQTFTITQTKLSPKYNFCMNFDNHTPIYISFHAALNICVQSWLMTTQCNGATPQCNLLQLEVFPFLSFQDSTIVFTRLLCCGVNFRFDWFMAVPRAQLQRSSSHSQLSRFPLLAQNFLFLQKYYSKVEI